MQCLPQYAKPQLHGAGTTDPKLETALETLFGTNLQTVLLFGTNLDVDFFFRFPIVCETISGDACVLK